MGDRGGLQLFWGARLLERLSYWASAGCIRIGAWYSVSSQQMRWGFEVEGGNLYEVRWGGWVIRQRFTDHLVVPSWGAPSRRLNLQCFSTIGTLAGGSNPMRSPMWRCFVEATNAVFPRSRHGNPEQWQRANEIYILLRENLCLWGKILAEEAKIAVQLTGPAGRLHLRQSSRPWKSIFVLQCHTGTEAKYPVYSWQPSCCWRGRFPRKQCFVLVTLWHGGASSWSLKLQCSSEQ